jgi:dihydrodipicolinate synthase/N-acetylneuraminate lyase
MPALITPFDERGEVDLGAHTHNMELLAGRGVTGFLIAGSTGEGPYLGAGERHALVERARRAVDGSAYLVCGVAAESVRQATAQIEEATSGGADAVLVLTPTSLARGNHDAVVRFFVHVADASPLPVFLYSVPMVTGYELPVAQVEALASHPNVIGMKDSGGRPVRIQELARSITEPFIMFAGASRALAGSLAAGGYGAITASANYASDLVERLVEASDVSNADAEQVQSVLSMLVGVIEPHGIVGTKAAAAARGLKAGLPRLPLVPLDDKATSQISDLLAETFVA